MLFSIIIPVYNAEKTLERCIQSVLEQDFNDFEIILIDDGSTDNSGIICEKYAMRYSNIFVKHKKNMGLSAARNDGIKYAAGKYVIFLDSDDYWLPNILGGLAKCAVNCELVIFGYKEVNAQHLHTKKYVNPSKYCCDNGIDGKTFLLQALIIEPDYQWYSWRYAILREYVKQISFQFPLGICYEDAYTTYSLLLQADKINIYKEIVVNYTLNGADSITGTPKLNVELNKLFVAAHNIKTILKCNYSMELKRRLCNNFSLMYYSALNYVYLLHNKREQKILLCKLKKLKWICRYTTRMKVRIVAVLLEVIGVNSTSRLLYLRNKYRS